MKSFILENTRNNCLFLIIGGEKFKMQPTLKSNVLTRSRGVQKSS